IHSPNWATLHNLSRSTPPPLSRAILSLSRMFSQRLPHPLHLLHHLLRVR
ncbi:MAG: hypothetical protein QOH93_672, partial [Chloroflexia bacterium]|nr:hypothetical protein [Chloroflexia bacterium]